MPMPAKVAKAIILAGIPFLAVPFFNESGMAGDRSQRDRSSAKYQIVKGEISKKNGDEITLRTSQGERITFRINDQTNQLCPKGTQTSQSSSMGADSSNNEGSSMSQGTSGMSPSGESSSGQSSANSNSSGQNQTAQSSMGKDSPSSGETSSSSLFGSSSGQASGQDSGQNSTGMQGRSQQSQQGGFRFGECNFKKGEFVKVKLDDNDDAIFVRSMGDSQEYYATGGVEGDYFVLPAGELGGLDVSDKNSGYTVKSSSDEEIGKIYKVMSNNEGDYSYAIIRKTDGQLISVPWQALEGSGKKSFKLKVTQSQLGNLPILEKGESSRQHVQKHWDLTEEEQQRLAKRNDQLDRFYEERDRYTTDTPTFRDNREGYDRYDYDQNRTSRSRDNDERSGGMSQRHYQDQNEEGFRTRRDRFSPTEFAPPSRAPQYEGADRQRSYDRNRQGRSYDSNNERNRSRSMSRSRGDNYGFSPEEYSPTGRSPGYEGADQSPYAQSRERDDHRGNRSDRYQTTSPRSEYNPQRHSSDRYRSQADQGDDKDYDYRPEGYR